jgi:hypothetical protein
MKEKFDRGTALSIFKSDRYEDIVALILSVIIALLVYIYI